MLLRIPVLALALGLALPAAAQPAPGDCALGTARAELDVNDVRARLFNHGNLFWSGDPNVYSVPRNGGFNVIYNAGLWLAGTVGGELRAAAARYDSYEFWPGPLLDDGSLPDPRGCSDWDRIWTVTRADIAAYYRTGIATPDLADWPAHLGAPFYDHDRNGAYDLVAGDQPLLRGDQVAWWVMNDVGNRKHETRTPPLGVEVQVEAFARVSTMPALHEATFYRYTVLYRGEAPVDSFYTGFYADTDLGVEANDDYIGSDSLRGLGYTYNSDDEDRSGYGAHPPALGVDLLDGAVAFVQWYGSAPCADEANEGRHYFNQLRGRRKCGLPVTRGGDGFDGATDSVTTWTFSGKPGQYWSEPCPSLSESGQCGAPIPGDERRMMISNGPYRLEPGDTLTFTVAVLWARGACAWDCAGSSVDRLFQASDYVQNAYDVGDLLASRPVPVPPHIGAEPPPPTVYGLGPAVPNPITTQAAIRYDVPEAAAGQPVRLSVYDVLGREVARLADGPAEAGRHTATVDAASWPSGVFLYRLSVRGGRSESRRFTVVR